MKDNFLVCLALSNLFVRLILLILLWNNVGLESSISAFYYKLVLQLFYKSGYYPKLITKNTTDQRNCLA